jgi:hypothetical protein
MTLLAALAEGRKGVRRFRFGDPEKRGPARPEAARCWYDLGRVLRNACGDRGLSMTASTMPGRNMRVAVVMMASTSEVPTSEKSRSVTRRNALFQTRRFLHPRAFEVIVPR